MPRRSVSLVRRLSEPRVRDSAGVHAEHRSVPWPFSFPVPRKNIAGRRNHNARPVLRHRDRRRTAFKCGRKLIDNDLGGVLDSAGACSERICNSLCFSTDERRDLVHFHGRRRREPGRRHGVVSSRSVDRQAAHPGDRRAGDHGASPGPVGADRLHPSAAVAIAAVAVVARRHPRRTASRWGR